MAGVTRFGIPLAEGISQADYDDMLNKWRGRFPHGLSGSEQEERFRNGGIRAALNRTDASRHDLKSSSGSRLSRNLSFM
jgi:hypothetical protein